MVIELNFSYRGKKMTKFVIFLNFIIQLENAVMFVNILSY